MTGNYKCPGVQMSVLENQNLRLREKIKQARAVYSDMEDDSESLHGDISSIREGSISLEEQDTSKDDKQGNSSGHRRSQQATSTKANSKGGAPTNDGAIDSSKLAMGLLYHNRFPLCACDGLRVTTDVIFVLDCLHSAADRILLSKLNCLKSVFQILITTPQQSPTQGSRHTFGSQTRVSIDSCASHAILQDTRPEHPPRWWR